jgi:rhodanese-related sulfurtransferase
MALSVDDLVAEAQWLVELLSPKAAAAAMADGAILIDTRCSEDRSEHGVVPGSIHHPRTVLEWRVDPNSVTRDPAVADRSTRLIIMCSDGYSSVLAGANLVRMGFERTGHVIGGFHAWKAAGLPVERLATSAQPDEYQVPPPTRSQYPRGAGPYDRGLFAEPPSAGEATDSSPLPIMGDDGKRRVG